MRDFAPRAAAARRRIAETLLEVFERWGWPLPAARMARAYDQAEAWLNTTREPIPACYAMFAREFASQLTGRMSAHAQASPWLDALPDESTRARFLGDYRALLGPHFPPQGDGRVLFPFHRLFVVAYR